MNRGISKQLALLRKIEEIAKRANTAGTSAPHWVGLFARTAALTTCDAELRQLARTPAKLFNKRGRLDPRRVRRHQRREQRKAVQISKFWQSPQMQRFHDEVQIPTLDYAELERRTLAHMSAENDAATWRQLMGRVEGTTTGRSGGLVGVRGEVVVFDDVATTAPLDDYTREALRHVAEYLEDLADDPAPDVAGICEAVRDATEAMQPLRRLTVRRYLDDAFQSWPKFSGRLAYPVPAADYPCARAAFGQLDPWAGPYGDDRRELALHTAEHFRKLANETNY